MTTAVSKTDEKARAGTPTASASEGTTLVELLYDPQSRTTSFAVWRDDAWTIERDFIRESGERLVPFSPENNLIKNEVIVLPSTPAEYGSKNELLGEIESFIHRYVDLEPSFKSVASHYVLLTWIYDAFNELPYLRFQGDFGTGKTRALLIIGSLCQRAFFASGASTVSPIFHILDAFGGTLIFDEADFRFSDERAEIVKILNNGNVRGMPVLRSVINRHREFNPTAFHVFGPKVVATRGTYSDQALESRFVTEEMVRRRLRSDVPINMPPGWKEEARVLRNKLLLYRFRHLHTTRISDGLNSPDISARLNQMFVPLLSVVEDESVRRGIAELARRYDLDRKTERGLEIEAQLLEIIRDLSAEREEKTIALDAITKLFIKRHGAEYNRPIANRWIGSRLRHQLHLALYKSHGVYVLPLTDETKLQSLYTHYGIDRTTSEDDTTIDE
jgi:hypothetical protein